MPNNVIPLLLCSNGIFNLCTMKRILIIITIIVSNYYGISGQNNLVPNGGFEYYTSCPSTFMQISYAYPWIDPNSSSSDYNNSCNQSVPCLAGCIYYQFPHSGGGYAAIECMAGLVGDNYREYIQVPLIDSLKSNHCYYVEFYTNKANSDEYAVNNIGAYISYNAIVSPYTLPYNLSPQILLHGNPVLTYTVNWVKVYGLYSASGGEKYLTIGNFQDDAHTYIMLFDSNSVANEAYYYIDDVSMYEIKTTNAGRDTTICHGDSVRLGTGNYEGLQYEWQPTTGLSNAGIGSPMASPNVTTTYYLLQTTPCGVLRDTVTITLGNCTVGVNELGIKNAELEIIPNPATNEIMLTSNQKLKTIHIYNVLSEEVFFEQLTTSNQQLSVDVSTWKEGIYFIEVETEKGVIRKKFIKN